jgi:hypothetical protein
VDFMKNCSADFFSLKTRGFSLHVLAPFLTINNVVCNTYNFSTYRNKFTNLSPLCLLLYIVITVLISYKLFNINNENYLESDTYYISIPADIYK